MDAVREAVILTRPVHVVAEATLVSEAIVAQGVLMESRPGSGPLDPHFPLETGSVSSTRTEDETLGMITT
jgi:hypothetical protein